MTGDDLDSVEGIDDALVRMRDAGEGRPYLFLFRDGLQAIIVSRAPPKPKLKLNDDGELEPVVQVVTKPRWSCFRADQVLAVRELDWPADAEEDDEGEPEV